MTYSNSPRSIPTGYGSAPVGYGTAPEGYGSAPADAAPSASITEGYSYAGVEALALYVEGQGDKFHPLSDSLQGVLHGFGLSDDPSDEEILTAVLATITAYEANPDSPYHGYHTDRLRGFLRAEDED